MCHDGYLRWIHSLEDDQAAYSVLSAAEAELVELLNARQQAEGLQAWLEEVAPDEHGTPTVLCVDNMAAGGLATTSPGSWSRLRLETSEGRIQVLHTPGERQVADIGTKPVPGPRLQVLRRLWGMCTAEEFENEEREVIAASLRGPDYYDLVRMFVWLMLVSKVPKSEAAEFYNKKPLEYDGSFEFYGLLVIAGIALLGVWELLKWVTQKILGEDPGAVARAKRLLRIRNQASKALQEELASMSSSSSDRFARTKVRNRSRAYQLRAMLPNQWGQMRPRSLQCNRLPLPLRDQR